VNFIKKHLKNIIMVLGSFVVINVAMFFVLKMTRPQMGPRSDTIAAADSASFVGPLAEVESQEGTRAPDTETVTAALDTTARRMPAGDTVQTAQAVPPPSSTPADETPAPQPAPTDMSPVATENVGNEAVQPVEEVTLAEEEDTASVAAQEEEARQLAKLAKLLETMKPDEAADIAAQLTTDQIIAVVMRMKDRTAGKLLAALPPETAARVAMQMSQVATRGRDGS